MRPRLFGLLALVAISVGGCSHLTQNIDGWQAHVVDANAARPEPSYSSTKDRQSGWQTLTDSRAGAWTTPVVTPVSKQSPHAVAHVDGPYWLDTGDQLRIFVYGQPNLSRIYKVDHKGNIMMPLIGIVKAQRRTVYQLASVIRSRLGARYVRDPQVTVDMHENRPFFILGEVRNPGQYPYVNGMTVEMAVATAGGFGPRASQRGFRISRRVDGVVEYDIGNGDYVIQAGDTIKVEERFF